MERTAAGVAVALGAFCGRSRAWVIRPLCRMKILHVIIVSLTLACFGCAHDPDRQARNCR